ncbi:AAA family ATPase [Anatilimnocola sp. NA78]|uniref:AAA family ATPase n=1 Tax=Anatilimnocola sp. NA78 TaxID=3415683 RepID=UPI003CE45422
MSSSPPDSNAGTIEFTCNGCGRSLKVPASAAGRKASCPQCYGVVQVPTTSAAPTSDISYSAPAPAAPSPTAPTTAWNPPAPAHQPTFSAPGSGAPAFAPPTTPPPAAPAPAPGIHLSPRAEPGRETPTKKLFDRITQEIGKLYVGQDELVLGALVALFSSGHVLIESVPGLGKTLFVRTLGKVLGCQFGRIQFTADLMPSDITGAPIFDMKTQEFRFRPGPVFTQFLLADEINRAPAKTHAALLEIMQEYRVTVDGTSHVIERPFLVLATQNPIESEGTYNLPEAQLDRFMFKLVVDYPQEQQEAQILQMHSQQLDLNERLKNDLQTITSPAEILSTIQDNAKVRIDQRLIDYINKIVRRTREWPQFHMGASPRAGLSLVQAARTLAAFAGRDYAVPDDVVQIALPALRHRVVLTAEAEVEGQKIDDLLTELIRSVEVPRI